MSVIVLPHPQLRQILQIMPHNRPLHILIGPGTFSSWKYRTDRRSARAQSAVHGRPRRGKILCIRNQTHGPRPSWPGPHAAPSDLTPARLITSTSAPPCRPSHCFPPPPSPPLQISLTLSKYL